MKVDEVCRLDWLVGNRSQRSFPVFVFLQFIVWQIFIFSFPDFMDSVISLMASWAWLLIHSWHINSFNSLIHSCKGSVVLVVFTDGGVNKLPDD